MKFKADQTSQKLRGGYYTPQNLADYVTKWVLSNHPASVLEPSCGDGAFIRDEANITLVADTPLRALLIDLPV